ncbi:MAG: hypothetical protein ABEJ31_13200 [Haloarculaceae archaeon]
MTAADSTRADARWPFDALTSPLDRRLLRALTTRDGAVPLAELAHALAAEADGGPPAAPAVQRHRVALVHERLPRLDEAGLLVYDDAEGHVRARPAARAVVDHPAWQHVEAVDAPVETVLSALSNERRRRALAAFEARGTVASLFGLATAVAAAEGEGTIATLERDRVDAVRTTLHHVHLPTLDEAGLVTYDAAARTASLEADRALIECWAAEAPAAAAPASPRPRPTAVDESVWTVEGRADVSERARALCDHADEELFAVFTTDGLLGSGSIDRLRAATQRGVDVTVGSRNAAVRDRVREAVPDATVWEPRLDWLNLPPARGGRLGRLVFADRRAALLATLSAESAVDAPAEIALTGEGERNGLVVLLADLLGPRLEHLDEQSADFRSRTTL